LVIVALLIAACGTTPAATGGAGQSASGADAGELAASEVGLEVTRAAGLIEQGRAPEALEILSPLIEAIEAQGLVDEVPEDVRNAYVQRGLAYVNTAAFAKSVESFRTALEIQQSVLPESKEREMRIYAALGNSLGMNGSPIGAIESFQMAVELNASRSEPDALFAAEMHRVLSTLYYEINNADASVEQLQRATEVLAGRDDMDALALSAMTYLRLTDVLRIIGRHGEARAAGLTAAEQLERAGAPLHLRATAYYYTAIAEMLGDESSGRRLFLRAIELFEQSSQPNYEYIGVAAYNVARTFRGTDQEALAIVYFRKAADAYARVLDSLEAENRRAPGSIPQNALESFRSRLADAERAVAELEAEAE
jgi:tetratricopeptide (TPR) repeat protein